MKKLLGSTFINLYFTTLCFGILLVISFAKGDIVLFINQHHKPYLDIFFKYATWFGDGLIFAMLAIVLLFINRKLLIDLALLVILQTLSVNIFKQWLFKGLARPKAFFSENIDLYFIDGVDVHSRNTFPSGHTATAFSVAAFLSFTFFKDKPKVQVVLFLIALLTAYSRMYLLQHFYIDVYVGALLGVLIAIIAMQLAKPFYVIKLRR